MHRLICVCFALMLAAATAQAKGRSVALERFQNDYPEVRISWEGEQVARLYAAPFGFGETAEEAADQFLRTYGEMFGVRYDELVPTGTQNVMNGTFTAVYYRQQYRGVPVDQSWLTLLVRHDTDNGIVLASPHLFDLSAALLPPVVISGDAVMRRMQKRYPDFTFSEPELVVYAVGERPTYAYRFEGGADDPADPQRYGFWVDAGNRRAPILAMESRILHTDVYGTVSGMGTPGLYPDRNDNPPVEMPIRNMRVRIVGGSFGETDGNGDYVIAHGGGSQVTVETSVGGIGGTQAGPWVRVDNQRGSELSYSQDVIPPGPADFLYNPNPSEYFTAQVNGFVHTTIVHNFADEINPDYPGIDIQLPCNVNINSNCNAYYDFSSINFYTSGGGCPNTAYTTVVYHEYGHFIVDKGYPDAWPAYADYHEGMADTTAAMLTDDPCLAIDFFGPGSGCLRDASNPGNPNYPCYGGSHTCGKVISSAFWLTRDELAASEPTSYLEIVRGLYLNSILLRPPGITPQVTIDVLTLDDDDGYLYNGTPHYDEIAAGFGAKNLTAPNLDLLFYPDDAYAVEGKGEVLQGGVEKLGDQDGDYWTQRGEVQLVTISLESLLVAETTVDSGSYSSGGVQVVMRATPPRPAPVQYRVRAWNYSTGAWVLLGTGDMPADGSPLSVRFEFSGNVNDFIDAGTRQMRVDIQNTTDKVLSGVLLHGIDVVKWDLKP